MDGIARILMLAGATLFGLGALFWLSESLLGGLRLGRIPGAMHIEREGLSIYIPITTMVILSVLGTGVMWLFRWWKS